MITIEATSNKSAGSLVAKHRYWAVDFQLTGRWHPTAWLLIGAQTVFLAMLLSACSPSESNVVIGNRTGVLHYGIGSEVQILDPHVLSDTSAWEISGALFEGLIRLNPETLEPEPGVERSDTYWDAANVRLIIHRNCCRRATNVEGAFEYRGDPHQPGVEGLSRYR